MIFKYPREFIVPIKTFKIENEVDYERADTFQIKEGNRVKEKIVSDIIKIKAEYEKDEGMWRYLDKYYSESETGMLQSYYNKN